MLPEDRGSREGIQTDRPFAPTGIQADRPLSAWELPGCFRLDCEPHRGSLLLCSAMIGLVFSLLSPLTYGLLLLAAVPLSLMTWLGTRRDLALMQKGMMDPRGENRTRQARDVGLIAFLYCCEQGALVLWLPLPWMRIWMVGL